MIAALLLFATLKRGTTSIWRGETTKKLTMAGLVALSGYCYSGNCADVGVDLAMVASTALAVVRNAPESGRFAAAHDTEDRIFLVKDGLEQARRELIDHRRNR